MDLTDMEKMLPYTCLLIPKEISLLFKMSRFPTLYVNSYWPDK